MEVAESVNRFTFEPDDESVMYIGEVQSFGPTDDACLQIGIFHFLLVLTSMGVEHPFSEKFGDREFGWG